MVSNLHLQFFALHYDAVPCSSLQLLCRTKFANRKLPRRPEIRAEKIDSPEAAQNNCWCIEQCFASLKKTLTMQLYYGVVPFAQFCADHISHLIFNVYCMHLAGSS